MAPKLTLLQLTMKTMTVKAGLEVGTRPRPTSWPTAPFRGRATTLRKHFWGQFHQHFTSSFYECRSQKHVKDWRIDCIFCSFVICKLKSFSWNVDEIDTRSTFLLRLATIGRWNRIQGLISPTFYMLLLHEQIPKTQKIQLGHQSFLHFCDLCLKKLCVNKMLMKLTQGVSFIISIPAAFEPIIFCQKL